MPTCYNKVEPFRSQSVKYVRQFQSEWKWWELAKSVKIFFRRPADISSSLARACPSCWTGLLRTLILCKNVGVYLRRVVPTLLSNLPVQSTVLDLQHNETACDMASPVIELSHQRFEHRRHGSLADSSDDADRPRYLSCSLSHHPT